jgi:signal transduction histidine kinase
VRLIEELRASRQRLVAAQDEERRRLERNIHDGAQQQLVALAVKIRLARAMAGRDAEKAQDLLDELQGEAQEALENLRDLARGIYPPLLADKGLAAALDAQARKVPLPVRVDPNGVGRYPPEAEATAYFCVLEALQNVTKYAEASSAIVRLRKEDGHLVFSVTDDGRGFDPAATPPGSGLQNMADRVEALGGSLDVDSEPGRGTTVTGRIPVRGEQA